MQVSWLDWNQFEAKAPVNLFMNSLKPQSFRKKSALLPSA
jgi:hypothetical protein